VDWTLGLIFRRDIAEMRLYTERPPGASYGAVASAPAPHDSDASPS
jgi:hypothetical protein